MRVVRVACRLDPLAQRLKVLVCRLDETRLEFIPADTPDDLFGAQDAAQYVCHALQRDVPFPVAEAIVDLFQVIQVRHEDTHPARAFRCHALHGVNQARASVEALIRWNHPELGMIPPDDFIPLFERNGRIGDVDKYVWNQAAKQIARWREEYGRTIPVSVNLSRVDVFDPGLEQTLDGILGYYKLDHDDLKLEVTESAYIENAEQVIQVVESLRRKGYQVEMDDFGTGYSSLNMLSAMPIDVLKMDRAFIRNIEQDERDIQLVALIIGIAQNLKIPVIAEGVETEKQVQLLRDLGCPLT